MEFSLGLKRTEWLLLLAEIFGVLVERVAPISCGLTSSANPPDVAAGEGNIGQL